MRKTPSDLSVERGLPRWVVHETCQQADPGAGLGALVQGRPPILYTFDGNRRAEAVRFMRR